jgi:hypothetical protein
MRIDVKQLEFVDYNLRSLLIMLEKNTGLEFTCTSNFRMDDPGVHGTLPLRGWDLRMRDVAIGSMCESLINSHYIYDPSRPQKKCAFLHGAGSHLHLHIQTHPNTRRRD